MAAQLIVAEEKRRAASIAARQAWLIHESGIDTNAGTTGFAMVRQALSAALIRAGRLLYGAPERDAMRGNVGKTADVFPAPSR